MVQDLFYQPYLFGWASNSRASDERRLGFGARKHERIVHSIERQATEQNREEITENGKNQFQEPVPGTKKTEHTDKKGTRTE